MKKAIGFFIVFGISAAALYYFSRPKTSSIKGAIIYDEPIGPELPKKGFWEGFGDYMLDFYVPDFLQPISLIRILEPTEADNMAKDPAQYDAEILARARDILISREGIRNDVYPDPENGLPTVGIGHLITSDDHLKLGDIISDARVQQLFNEDISRAFDAAKAQSIELGKYYVTNFTATLVSVNFQLGTGWRSKFPNTWNALVSGDWQKAINNLDNSLWNRQTPKRVNDFKVAIREAFSTGVFV